MDKKLIQGDPDEEGEKDVLRPLIPQPEEPSRRPRAVEVVQEALDPEKVTLLILYKDNPPLRLGVTLEIASSVVRDFERQKTRSNREAKQPPQPIVLRALNQAHSFLTIDSDAVLTMVIEDAFDKVEIGERIA